MASKKEKRNKDRKARRNKSKDSEKSKKQRLAEREAKKAARKGDGSFPDILVVTKEKNKDSGKRWFYGHNGDDMSTLYENDQVVGVYKLRRVSKMVINRKIAR